MSFDPKAIKAAVAAGVEARARGLREEPPYNLSAQEKAAWRMGWEQVVCVSANAIDDLPVDDLLDDDDPLPAAAPHRPADPNDLCQRWGYHWQHPLHRQISNWEDEFRRGPLPPERAAVLAKFVEENRDELTRMAHYRNPVTGGIPAISRRARKVLGLTKRAPTRGQSGPRDAARETDLKATGWSPSKNTPGNCWREFYPPGERAGRVTVYSREGVWRVMEFHAGASGPKHWDALFPTADAARTEVASRLNLHPPQLS